MGIQGGCSGAGSVQAVEDRLLVARVAARDQVALADIYDRYGGLVFGIARRVLCDDTRAEDVTQDVFVYVWNEPERFDAARGSLRSWLGLLAHRRSVDRVRADIRRARGEGRLTLIDEVAPADSEVEDELARRWLACCVRDALAQLPAEQREAVTLAYFGGRTYRQVAAELGIPEGTAKSRVRLALAKLDDLLRPRLGAQPSLAGQDTPAWT